MLVKRKQADKIGCEWNAHQRRFLVADCHGEAPPVALTPQELIELGVELVCIGTDQATEGMKVH